MHTITQRLAQAVQHHEAGRLDQAEALYRDILQEVPHHPHALHLLGVRLHQAAKHREALDLIQRALKAHGPHPVFHSNLGAVYLALGLLVEAEGHSREAIRLQPNFPDAFSNLGLALRGKGQLDESVAAFREALRLNPQHGEARRHLAQLPPAKAKLSDALSQLQQTILLDPANTLARHDLAQLLLAGGQAEEAIPHLREAIRLRPDFAPAHRILGVALQQLDRVPEAVDSFREALRHDPALVRARINLALALQARGQFDEAVVEFRAALNHDPANSQALYSLSEMAVAGRHSFSEEAVNSLRERASRDDLPIDDLCRLNYAAAQLLDRAGSFDGAFAHCRRANELRKEIDRQCGLVFDPAAHQKWIDRIIATFTPAHFERVKALGSESELPVFIVGMLRSGTTLAEQILASHPRVHGAGELRDIESLCRATLPQRLGDHYPECVTRLDATSARGVAEGHLQKLGRLGGEAVRVIDKRPLNFPYLGTIVSLFPRARIIHCVRDPVDTCVSCYFQNFAGPLPFVRDLAHLGAYYREYERLMAHWKAVLPVSLFELSYEELTANQEETSRRLVEFCGLEWDDRCLRFHETERVIWTASLLQVRRPMYRHSVGRWRRYESHLQPLLESLAVK